MNDVWFRKWKDMAYGIKQIYEMLLRDHNRG